MYQNLEVPVPLWAPVEFLVLTVVSHIDVYLKGRECI